MSKIKRFFDIVFSGSYDLILTGLKNTFIIALGGLVIGIIIGCIVATFKVAGGRNKIARCISYIGDIYTGIFRGTPIVVQLLISHFVVFRTMTLDPVLESMLVFGLNSGAYVSEIMRGGILSVDIGQTEAGRTLGLSYTTTMIKIVIPQAIKNVVPTLGNELIALIKDTSVASFIGTVDLNSAFTTIAGLTLDYMVPYLCLALLYLIIVIFFTIIVRFVERRMRKSERR